MPISLDVARINKVLRMASHGGTPLHEKRSAAARAREMLINAGVEIEHLSVVNVSDEMSRPHVDLSETNARTSAAREARRAAARAEAAMREERDALISENERLRRTLEGSQAKIKRMEDLIALQNEAFPLLKERLDCSDTGREYVDFDAITAVAERRTGRKFWKPAVAFILGITMREIRAWAEVGVIPVEFVERLDAAGDGEFLPASREKWTAGDDVCFKYVLDNTSDDLEAAQALTKKMRRCVHETTVTRKRLILRRNEGWLPSRNVESGERCADQEQ